MRIKVLDTQVVNLIAAGEVVDRPAQVVRELVDNAVDAGAGEIAVYLASGGQTSVRVVDNGCGMTRDDALLAFERHATSKVCSAEDLNAIRTMGFRGEALPAIAAVAKVRLATRSEQDAAGSEVRVEGGKLQDVRSAALPVGTEVEVRHLFFNLPARRKFLKSPRAEELRIKQWLLHSSLSRPEIHYRLFADDREVLNLAKRAAVPERAAQVFRGTMVSFERSAGPCRMLGMLGHPAQAQADTGSLVILVNDRLVNDRVILKAVKEGFSPALKSQEFPIGFISIALPPGEVDVNVHPQKSEVRFRSGQAVFLAVREAVRQAVAEFKAPLAADGLASVRAAYPLAPARNAQDLRFSARAEETAVMSCVAEQRELFMPCDQAGHPGEGFSFSALRYVGQIFSCYLVCESKGTLYVVDMHAAHERINYNILKKVVHRQPVPVQRLLIAEEVELSEEGLYNLQQHLPVLEAFGFEIAFPAAGQAQVHGVPSLLAGKPAAGLLGEMAGVPYDQSAQYAWAERLDYMAARIACHASVRSGQKVSKEEVYALFADLDAAQCSAACPHGRPVVVSFSEDQVEKWFGRRN